ncbi:MAG TPA: hypothetical protein VGO40_07370 [Longimicrobium sp.]|jgi:hypothetical protein|nr:hypothetical protein [Longimicrobium sp.]
MRTWLKAGQVAVLALGIASTGGCMAAAVGAGAGAGIYLTSQGASGMTNTSAGAVAARVPGVLSDLGITVTGHNVQNNGAEHEWMGTRGDEEIHVQVKAESSGTTQVSASAKKNMAEWDKDFARTIVTRITGR